MIIPSDLKYTRTDEWVKVDGSVATVGISDYAQEQLSDIVFVEVTVSVGESIKKDTVCATVESVKAAADVNLPVSGTVTAVNENLPGVPEKINTDPYGEAWMLKVEISDPSELDRLMDAAEYDTYCKERAH
ncbi:MAG TPA: glycine cleavage system protein GcvH [Anaerolineaceae bacterium]|nr:glycine cleavage system protein GcvH [Anaerolineaceae bacterium]